MRPTDRAEPGWGDLRRAPDDPRPPGSLVVGIALVVELAWLAAAGSLGVSRMVQAVGVVSVAVVASWSLTVPASLVLGVVSFLVVDGFVQGTLGQLSWDGQRDLILVLIMLLLPGLSAELAYEVRRDRSPHETVASTTSSRSDGG